MDKITVGNYKNVMSKSEMMMTKGGANVSSMCAEGQLLYTCYTYWEGGSVSSGKVCGLSATNAGVHLRIVRVDQGLSLEGTDIACY